MVTVQTLNKGLALDILVLLVHTLNFLGKIVPQWKKFVAIVAWDGYCLPTNGECDYKMIVYSHNIRMCVPLLKGDKTTFNIHSVIISVTL